MKSGMVAFLILVSVTGVPFLAEAQSPSTSSNPSSGPIRSDVSTTSEIDSIDDIVVTGSRGLQRTVTTSATPIDVIQSAELERTGKADVLSALNALVPSFDAPVRSGGMAGTIIATGGLRGLNPDQTLILVNGKRRHKTSLIMAGSSSYNGAVPADLSLIPVSAIDHIEVLRDGAAAKYGSDAIAGVINIILKKDTGDAGSVSAGQNYDRADGQLYQAQEHLGETLSDKGFINFSLDAREQHASNRANDISPTISLYNPIAGQPDPREDTINRLVTENYGALPQKTLDTAYNASYGVGGFELYSFGTVSFRRSDLEGTFRAPNNPVSLPEIYPNGFRPDVIINEQDFEFALGSRGLLFGWNVDISSTYGMNRARNYDANTLNGSLGPTSPTYFYLGSYKSTEWVNSLDLTRGFEVAGNLQVSSGLQHRYETYRIYAGDPASYAAGTYVIPAGQGNAGVQPAPGSQGVSGITPTDVGHTQRNNLAAYLDVEYDPSTDLTLDVAGRYEHFDDSSGNTFNGEASGRYAFTPWLAVRGAASTGFRAPSLAQEIYSSTTGQFLLVNGQTALSLVKLLPVDSAAAVALGAKPLTPEKSTNFSAGVVLTPTSALNVTLDAYDIRIRHRISVTGTLGGPAVSEILVSNGLASDISAQYFTNALDTKTTGVDLVLTYRLNLGLFGDMHFNGSFNYNKTAIESIIPNPLQLSSLGPAYVLFDRLTKENIVELLPKRKIVLGDTWSLGKFNLALREVRYGGYTIPQESPASDREFGAKWITDLEVGWQVTSHFDVALGADNVFNTYPDPHGIYNNALGAQQYGASPASPFGFTGGFYYARLSFSF